MEDSKNKAKKPGGLGKGLSALLSDSDFVNATGKKPLNTEVPAASINEIDIHKIETNPFQPRIEFEETALQELSESIKIQGLIQPITVRQLNDGAYQLISGERRLRASKLAGLTAIPAYIRTANDQQMLEMALIENIQRENLNPMEIAFSYQRLIAECNLKQEELGDRVGKARPTINNYLRLLKLPPDIQAALKIDRISMGHARALAGLDRIEDQLSIFKKIVTNDLSVRKAEEEVRKVQADKQQTSLDLASDDDSVLNEADLRELKKMEQRLRSYFSTRVSVQMNKGRKGEIKIPYASIDDLNRIIELLDL